MLLICQLFGVAPVNIPTYGGHRRCTILWQSLLITGAHIVWSAFVLALVAWSHYQEYFRSQQNLVLIERCLIYAEYLFNMLNCSLIMVGAYYNRRGYIETQRQMDALDQRLWPTIDSQDDDELRRYLRGIYASIAMFVAIMLTILVCIEVDVYGVFIGMSSFALPNVIVMLALALYCCLMRSARKRFERIAGELLVICGNVADGVKKPPPAVNNNMFEVEFKAVIGSQQRPVVNRLPPVERLNEMREVYHNLCRIMETINSWFGHLIIGMLLAAMIIITGQLYSIYANVNSSTALNLVYSVVWMLSNSMRVVLVLYWNGDVMGAVSVFLLALCNWL